MRLALLQEVVLVSQFPSLKQVNVLDCFLTQVVLSFFHLLLKLRLLSLPQIYFFVTVLNKVVFFFFLPDLLLYSQKRRSELWPFSNRFLLILGKLMASIKTIFLYHQITIILLIAICPERSLGKTIALMCIMYFRLSVFNLTYLAETQSVLCQHIRSKTKKL